MRYKQLAEVFEQLSSTNSRLEKTAILASFLKIIPDDEVEETILLLEGRVFPEWDSRTVGIAAKLILKAIASASGYDEREVTASFQKHGDLGLVAQELFSKKKQQTLFSSPLELKHVFKTLQKIASLEGNGSQDRKLAELGKLLTSADAIEAKFIVRTVIEDLRIGIAQGTLRDALAYAFFTKTTIYIKSENKLDYELKEGVTDINLIREKIKRALDLTADFAVVMKHIKEGKSLDDIQLSIGTPAKCMLARKERSFADAFARTGLPVRVEYKYDGFRLQIHKEGDKVYLFTRRLEDVTKQFPDVEETIRQHISAKNCILDAEAVGYDPTTKKYQPFQHISKRIRRKYAIEELAKELPVELNVFDILFLDEEVLFEKPLHERLEILNTVVQDVPGKMLKAKGMIANNEEEAQAFYQESLDAGNEGIMLKNIEASYEPGGRVSAWIKMKPIMDELDLVITRAEWGTGKRSEWMTSFTLACRTEEGELLEIGKVGTGMKELDNEDPDAVTFSQLTKLLEPLVQSREGQEVVVKPDVVLSIAYEEIQKSPSYSSGYALRFPRVLALRSDRNIDDIASIEDVEELYYGQN